jgi:hypothetical protein
LFPTDTDANGKTPTIRERVTIDAPIADVFDYVAAPENHVDTSPTITSVSGAEELPGGGNEAGFTLEMLGRTLRGHVRDVELVPPNRRVFDVEGDVDARTTYELTAGGRETLFVFMNEVEPPSSGVLGRLVGSVLGRYLERNARATMENTRTVLEARGADRVSGRP